MQRFLPVLIVVAIVLAILSTCVFIVRERDAALVFALGEVKETITEPGLYFKLPPPFQNAVLLDKRLQTKIGRASCREKEEIEVLQEGKRNKKHEINRGDKTRH